MAASYVVNFDASVRRNEPNSSPNICIYKIHNEYVPRHIGLGLYHHSDTPNDIQNIDEVKQQTVDDILGERLHNRTEQDLVQSVRERLPDIKSCYMNNSEYFTGIDDSVQAKNFVMDACFIIQFYISDNNRARYHDLHSITEDILMFQNQVPLFLLLDIMELVYGSRGEAVNRLANSLARYQPFQTLLPFAIPTHETIIDFLKGELSRCHLEAELRCHHLLHLLNKVIIRFLSPESDNCTPGGSTAPITCYHLLERLDTYRIKFRARNREVWFEEGWLQLSGTLHLPKIRLDEATAPLHRNLMDFAQCTRHDRLICDFTFLLSYIVKERNEHLFREKGIIQGNGARFFERVSRLCGGDTLEAGRYAETIKSLENYCESRSNRYLCSVRDFWYRHFSLPVVISFLALVGSVVVPIYIDHLKK